MPWCPIYFISIWISFLYLPSGRILIISFPCRLIGIRSKISRRCWYPLIHPILCIISFWRISLFIIFRAPRHLAWAPLLLLFFNQRASLIYSFLIHLVMKLNLSLSFVWLEVANIWILFLLFLSWSISFILAHSIWCASWLNVCCRIHFVSHPFCFPSVWHFPIWIQSSLLRRSSSWMWTCIYPIISPQYLAIFYPSSSFLLDGMLRICVVHGRWSTSF